MLRNYFFAGLLILLLTGCATLRPDFEEPVVSVTSFRVIPSNSVVPKFEIGLHVINPNRTALELAGIAYTISLEGHKVLTGVSNKLPVIDAYGEGDVQLQATPDLMNSIGLFADLMRQPRQSFRYDLVAKLDVGGWLPRILVEKTGEISISRYNGVK